MFILLSLSPVAFDMEWRFYFVERGLETSKRMIERRTAVVQVADSNGFILVIQIYNMNRMFVSALFFPFVTVLTFDFQNQS